jgi:hypothetical protein
LRRLLLTAACAWVIVAAETTLVVGSTVDEIGRMGLSGQWSQLPARLRERTAELRERFNIRQMPSHAVTKLQPFFQYLDRCTAPTDRLFVAGFMPEVPYYAARPFGGGQSTFVSGYYGSAENQHLVIERLHAHRVPFVLMPASEANDFADGFPDVATYLRGRYVHMANVEVDDDHIEIQIDGTLTGPPDAETGWPCLR